jgi:hypothetical protein
MIALLGTGRRTSSERRITVLYCFVLSFEQGKTDLYVCIPADITSTNESTAALQAGYCSALVTRESAKGMKAREQAH